MLDIQRVRSRVMLEASIDVVPNCLRSLARTSPHRERWAPRGLDRVELYNLFIYLFATLTGNNIANGGNWSNYTRRIGPPSTCNVYIVIDRLLPMLIL